MSYPSSLSSSDLSRELCLNGTSAYTITGNRVLINIEEIANNRSADNLSGTLAIELWALSQPWQGAQFSGVCLAATEIGEVRGNHVLPNCQYDLNFTLPPAGSWSLCLMLREWENGAYVTRDTITFANPYVVDAPTQTRNNVRVTREDANNVINVAFSEKNEAAPAIPAAKGMDELVAKKPQQAAVTAKKPAQEKPQPEKPAPAKTPVATAKAAASDTRISINQAKLGELETIKGVSKKLAKAIVDGRPYKQLEDLLGVKGMGKKLLDSIRSTLKV